MARTDALYALVRSLSSREKQHFKREAGAHAAGARYVELFDAIAHAADREDAELQADLSRQFGKAKLPVLKKYLFDALTRSLMQYAEGRRLSDRAEFLIRQGRFLHYRGLYKRALKSLEKAQNLAQKSFRHDLEVQALEAKRLVVASNRGSLFPADHIHSILADMARSQTLAQETILAKQVYYRCFDGTWRKQSDDPSVLEGLLTEPAFAALATTSNAYARLYYLGAWSQYYQIINDYKASEKAQRQVLELYLEHPGMQEEHPGIRISVSSNLGNRLLLRRELEGLVELLEGIRNTAVEEANLVVKRYECLGTLGCLYGALTAQPISGTAWQEIMDAYPVMESRMSQPFRIDYRLKRGLYHLAVGEPAEALDFFLANLSDIGLESMPIQEAFTHLAFLVAHFEAGNSALAGERANARLRRQRRKGFRFDFEAPMLQLLVGLGVEPLPEKRRALLDQALEKLENTREEADFAIFFPMDSWIQAKRDDVPYQSVVARQTASLPRIPARAKSGKKTGAS